MEQIKKKRRSSLNAINLKISFAQIHVLHNKITKPKNRHREFFFWWCCMCEQQSRTRLAAFFSLLLLLCAFRSLWALSFFTRINLIFVLRYWLLVDGLKENHGYGLVDLHNRHTHTHRMDVRHSHGHFTEPECS